MRGEADSPAHERLAAVVADRFDDDQTGHDMAHAWRVYHLGRRLSESEGADFTVVVAAALATSLLFGAGHAANPAATLRGVAIIACYGGLLAATVLLTGRIAVAVGFHLTWNLAISSVFGFPVSGFTAPVTVLAVEQSGPALVTGGRFGPEAGLVSLVALALGTAVVVGWVRWREGELSLRIPWSRDGSPRRAR